MAPKAAVVEMPNQPAGVPPANVYQKIAAVMRSLSLTGISKSRSNAQQNYKFRGIDETLNALSPLLAEQGLIVVPRMLSRTMTERTTQKGQPLFTVVVDAEFDFVSMDDGSRHTAKTFGEAMDTADKATNKAMSVAYKYAAFLTFCIPLEGMAEDADAVTHEVAPAFDEIGYHEWLNNLSLGAKVGGLKDLVETIKNGPVAFQDALRADKKSWTALKALTDAEVAQ